MSKVFTHSSEIRVRYADTDKMGIVYNGTYLTYFEVGRTELMRSLDLPYIYFEQSGYLLPLIEAHLNFKTPAVYDDLLEVKTYLDFDKNSARIKFDYNIFKDKTTIAEGYTVHTFMNSVTRKPVRPPSFLIEGLENR